MSKGVFKKRKVDALEGIESTCGEISITAYTIAKKLEDIEKRLQYENA